MNSHMKKNLVIGSGIALMITLVISSPVRTLSAEPENVPEEKEATMMESCQHMMKQKQKMMAEMKAEDAELTEQIAKMNSAPDDKKQELMAGIITQLVNQRIAGDARKAKMQDEMMQHMMQHMQVGKESMTQCPMMKGMKGMKKQSGSANKEQLKEQK